MNLPAKNIHDTAAAFLSARRTRRGALAVLCGTALTLAACGGGGDSTVTFGVNAVVGGQPFGGEFGPGAVGTLDVLAGQSIELDANEPVVWAFSIGNSPLFGNGTTVFFDGLAITETAVSPSRVVVDTAIVGPFVSPAVIVLTATSTIDAALVATIDIVIH